VSLLHFIGLGKELVDVVDCHTWEGDEVLVANGIEYLCKPKKMFSLKLIWVEKFLLDLAIS